MTVIAVATAAAGIVVGMGLPTTANNIATAALVASIISHIAGEAGMMVPAVAIHLAIVFPSPCRPIGEIAVTL